MTLKFHNRFRSGILLAALALASVCASAQTGQGTISGTVYGPDGKGLGGTSVWANAISPVQRPADHGSTVQALATVSADDGSFTISQVPPGEYILCARNEKVEALNPCTWGGAPLVTIANGSLNVTGEAIRMAAGATLHVHLDDAAGLLEAHEGKTRGASLLIGLGTTHGFIPIPIAGASANSREHKLLVPFDATHNVVISTRFFKLTDAGGVPLGAAAIPVSIPSGTQGKPITLRVVGAGN